MKKKGYNFEKLDVWKKSMDLVSTIYITQKSPDFPREEKFGLGSQMKRAAVSISSNIAEGSTRHSLRQKAYFYSIAYGSAVELLTQTIIAKNQQFIKQNEYEKIRSEIDEICAMLSGLRRALNPKP